MQQPFQRVASAGPHGPRGGPCPGQGLGALWLTAWVGNHRARSFYEALGYQDVGATRYFIEGQGLREPGARQAAAGAGGLTLGHRSRHVAIHRA